MRKYAKKFGILLAIFVFAVTVYFIWNMNVIGKEDTTIYTTLEEATLPVVYIESFGRDMNYLHGYYQDMGHMVARDALTILPPERDLSIQITEYQTQITGVSYEIRSLDMERLIEKTSVTTWEDTPLGIRAVLPIQNMLEKEEEYLLTLTLDLKDQGPVYYYTRVKWSDYQAIGEMVTFALDFTAKTFNKEEAKTLASYLETSSLENNTSLANVTIRSNFSQLTWANSNMVLASPIQTTLKEYNGNMSNIQLNYTTSRVNEVGDTDYFEVSDNYTLKWSSNRIYLMDYIRKTNQIFSGKKELFSGNQISLGILNGDAIAVTKSPDKNHLVYVVNRELWGYDQRTREAVKIFSFRSGKDDGIRSSYDQNGVQILDVKDNGDVDFLVYGYMNRGTHEGYMGISLNQYQKDQNTVEERLFIPVVSTFEEIKQDLQQLVYLGTQGMLYLKVDHGLYGIDLVSHESLVIADGLEDSNFAISEDKSYFAWQIGEDPNQSQMIYLFDLDSGTKREIRVEENQLIRALGFVGNDFVYGLANKGDEWVINNRVVEMPMYALEILGADGIIETRYGTSDFYITSVEIGDARIHLKKVHKVGEKSYTFSMSDTIVSNQEVVEDGFYGIGTVSYDGLGAVYVIKAEEEQSTKSVKISTPKKVVYDTTQMLELKANRSLDTTTFYVYGQGKMLGFDNRISTAIAMAYDKMGIVVDQNHKVVWSRINRSPSYIIKEPVAKAEVLIQNLENLVKDQLYVEGVLLLNARGSSLNQMLYFINQGLPVVAYRNDGSYVVLFGYDQYNISMYDPGSGGTSKMGLNDADEYFKSMGNDFVCGVMVE